MLEIFADWVVPILAGLLLVLAVLDVSIGRPIAHAVPYVVLAIGSLAVLWFGGRR